MALYFLADAALSDGDVDKANEITRKLETLAPGTESLAMLRANMLAAQGNPDEALKILDSISTPSPAAVELRTRINAINSNSTSQLEKQLETGPKNPAVLGRLCS